MTETDESPGAATPPAGPLLSVRELVVQLAGTKTRLVDGVTFDIREGERMGLVGESGSGKTMTALALLGLLTRVPAKVTGGSIVFDGVEYVGAAPREVRRLRGREIAMIFQEPMTSLNPSYTVGEQIAEGIRRHRRLSRKAAWAEAVELLDSVRIPSAARRANDYPHVLSGGMRQRVMIASALACRPRLLIADEPTTALDVTVQSEILQLLRELQDMHGMGVLFVTHDLSLVSEFCTGVTVMYAGQTAQSGPVGDVFHRPEHPYVEALFRSIPSMLPDSTLRPIPGEVPGPDDWSAGCRYFSRCDYAVPGRCDDPSLQRLLATGPTSTRCVRHDELRLEGVRLEHASA
ncbi:ABC transporter ATP-binding protein [Actinophytocola sp.]|uniref:ABC transporter ATP-binding protein n=1 Tax=Actinophytocola sp. TaxID=1872138 RepID=UPI003D6C47D2